MDEIKKLSIAQIASIDNEVNRFLDAATSIKEAKVRGDNPVARDGGFVSILTIFGLWSATLNSVINLHADDQAVAAKANLTLEKLASCIREWQNILNDPTITPGGPTSD